MKERLIGIDFGTSTSLIKVKTYQNGKPVDGDKLSTQYVEFDSRATIPTIIQESEGELYFGYEAIQPKPGERVYTNFKLDLENPGEEERKQARKLTEQYFRYLFQNYREQEMHFGTCDREKTIVSYPAKWKEETRKFMETCAEKAGFQNVEGMDEPTAAFQTVFIQEEQKLRGLGCLEEGIPLNALLVDMGAGTTDLALCRYLPGEPAQILETWPKEESSLLFGGHEMDLLLLNFLCSYLEENQVPANVVKNFAVQNKENCKAWKEDTVSKTLERGKEVAFCSFTTVLFQMLGISAPSFPKISRKSLETMAEDYLSRFCVLVTGILNQAVQEHPDFPGAEAIDLVILTGGHSQWYFTRELLLGQTVKGETIGIPKLKEEPERIIRLSRPQETVGCGMVYSPQSLPKGERKEKPGREEKPVKQEEPKRQEKKEGQEKAAQPGKRYLYPAGSHVEKMESEEALERLTELCTLSRSQCLKILNQAQGDFQKALYLIYEEFLFVEDEDLISYVTEKVKSVYGPYRIREGDCNLWVNRYQVLLPKEDETLLFWCWSNQVFFSNDHHEDCYLFTTKRVIQFYKNKMDEYPYEKIRYFFKRGSWKLKGEEKEWHSLEVQEEHPLRKLIPAVYLRWRFQEGKPPFVLDRYAYYESVGDAQSLVKLGNAYVKAENWVPHVLNGKKALEAYQRAVRLGSRVAMLNLSYCYYQGIGEEKNYLKAAQWADRFFKDAQAADSLAGGVWFYFPSQTREAVRLGDGWGPWFLGILYEDGGYGLEKDREKAIQYYRISRQFDGSKKGLARLTAGKVFSFFKR